MKPEHSNQNTTATFGGGQWRGTLRRVEVFRNNTAVFETLNPDAPAKPGSGVRGCASVLGVWLALSLALGLFMALYGLGIVPAMATGGFLALMGMFTLLGALGTEGTRRPTMKLVWWVTQGLRWLIGRARMIEEVLWIRQEVILPVEITVDDTALRWRVLREDARTLKSRQSSNFPGDAQAEAYHVDPRRWDNMELLLDENRFTITLTRPPTPPDHDDAAVHISIRDVQARDRQLVIAASPEGWLGAEAVEQLPRLDQPAVRLASRADRDAVLQAIGLMADTVGVALPASLAKVRG